MLRLETYPWSWTAWTPGSLDLHGGARKQRPELDTWVVRIAEGQLPVVPRTRSVGRRGGSTSGGGVAARREEEWWCIGRRGGSVWGEAVRGGAWGSEGWRVATPLGTRECRVGRG
jgi:hypothetical protein